MNTVVKGSFVSDGTEKYLPIPIGADWLVTRNVTVWQAVAGAGSLLSAYWQKDDMRYAAAAANVTYGLGTLDTGLPIGLTNVTGFIEYDSGTDNPLGTALAGNAITNANPPLVTIPGATGTLKTGDIVRMRTVTGGTQLNGLDFTIGNLIADTSFTLINMPAIVVATDSTLYPVKFQDIFYPRTRVISKITLGVTTVIAMTVNHDFAVGDIVRVVVPDQFGTKEINNVAATITAITDGTITVDYDSTGFTAFAFPLTDDAIPQYAQIVPMSTATSNTGEFGLILNAGAAGPAGVAGNYIAWIAGTGDIPIY